jgi:small subunit ribosomal protein S9
MAKKIKNLQYYEAIGRRKESLARVRLYLVSGKEKTVTVKSKEAKELIKIKQGEIFVNHKPIASYFSSNAEKSQYLKPLKVTNNEDRFAVSVLIRGGGLVGQLEALVLGLSRAIEKADKDSYRPILKKEGFLTRDARTRERRKVGTGGKARRQKQSPKR